MRSVRPSMGALTSSSSTLTAGGNELGTWKVIWWFKSYLKRSQIKQHPFLYQRTIILYFTAAKKCRYLWMKICKPTGFDLGLFELSWVLAWGRGCGLCIGWTGCSIGPCWSRKHSTARLTLPPHIVRSCFASSLVEPVVPINCSIASSDMA